MSALSKLRQQKEVLERLIQFVLSADLISDLSLSQSEFSTSNVPSTSSYDHDHLVDMTVPFLICPFLKVSFLLQTLPEPRLTTTTTTTLLWAPFFRLYKSEKLVHKTRLSWLVGGLSNRVTPYLASKRLKIF